MCLHRKELDCFIGSMVHGLSSKLYCHNDMNLLFSGLASPARCMVRENQDYTSIVHLFVMRNSRSGSLTNKIGCRNSLTPGDLKNHRFGLLSVNYKGAVKFF